MTGVDASNYHLTATGTAAGTIEPPFRVCRHSSTYLVSVTQVIGDGTMQLDLNGSGTAMQDLASNAISRGLLGRTSLHDQATPPTVAWVIINGALADDADTDTFTITFTDR